MKKGFTLIEMLAVIVILSILAVIIAPTIQRGLDSNYDDVLEIQKKNIIKAAKDWSLEHPERLPINNGDTITISLGELKKGYLELNVKNPKNNKIWVDSSYILVTNENGNYTYKITNDSLYEPDECEIFNFENSNYSEQCIIGNGDEQYLRIYISTPSEDFETAINNNEILSTDAINRQFILNNNQVAQIDSSKENVYQVIFTILKNKGKTNEKCLKMVRTITISNQCY